MFSKLARLLLCTEHTVCQGVEECPRKNSQVRFAASFAHDFGRVRGDRRGFRIQSRCLRVPFAAIGALQPARRNRRLSAAGRGGAWFADSVPAARRLRLRAEPWRPTPPMSRRDVEARLNARSRRAPRPGLGANRTARGAGAAIARRRTPERGRSAPPPPRSSITAITEASSGSEGAGASIPTRDAARSSRRRIGHQSPMSAVAAPSAQPLRSDFARVSSAWRAATRLDSVSRGARRARHRAHCGGQPDEVQPLALERFGCARKPVLAPRPCGSAEAPSRSSLDNGRGGCTGDAPHRRSRGRHAARRLRGGR